MTWRQSSCIDVVMCCLLLPPCTPDFRRAIVWKFSVCKSIWTLQIFAYFYFFRTFRILWVDFKGLKRFYALTIPCDSTREVKGSRRKYRIIRTFSSRHKTLRANWSISHVYSVTLQRVLEYNFTEMLLQESKTVDKDFVNFPYWSANYNSLHFNHIGDNQFLMVYVNLL